MNALRQTASVGQLRRVWKKRARKFRRSCFGVDRVSAATFEANLEQNLRALHYRLLDDKVPFRPSGLLGLAKKKPHSDKYRIICVPTIEDRLVQASVLETLKGKLRFMGIDNPISYGIAEGADRSAIGARRDACRARSKHPWVYKTDIQQFFDNIDRDILAKAVSRVVRHPSLSPLLNSFLATEITDGFDKGWRNLAKSNGIQWSRGVRQGMPLSPLFAGAYLQAFDREMRKTGVPIIRYVDDIIGLVDSKEDALKLHEKIKAELSAIGLDVGEPNAPASKTKIFDPFEPADFLGMEIARSPSGTYRLRISDDCIADCAGRLDDAGDIEYLLQKNVQLTNMGRYFDSVSNGFLNSYDAASNRDDLRDAISHASAAAQERILKDLFGTKQLKSLNNLQLQFIGLDRTAAD